MTDKAVVLVTGCSTGIGRAAAQALARRGAHVVATARNVSDIAGLEGPMTDILPLDVTDEDQCRAVIEATVRKHGHLDALVNNAGYGVHLPVEDTSEKALRDMFEVNLFGVHRLSRLALPHMRRQQAGRIVNVASIAGHVSVPMMGGYCSTKFALVALTQALHNELKPFNVHACLVEPGVIKTRFGQRSLEERRANVPEPRASPYAHLYESWEAMRLNRRGADARIIAKAIVHACLDQRPRFHYFAPFHAKAANAANRILPDAPINLAMRLWFRLKHRRAQRRSG